MYVDSACWDALLAQPLMSQPVLDAYLEPTPLLLINAPSALPHVKPVLMQALVKPVKRVMNYLVQAVFNPAPSLVLHAMLMEDA